MTNPYNAIGGIAAKFAGTQRPWNVMFIYANVTRVKIRPFGMDGLAYVPMVNSAGQLLITTFSGADWVITTTGAGGLHDDHAEAADTGYDIYLVAGPSGVTSMGVPTGTTIDGTKMAAFDDGTYTFWSRPAWFVRNDSAGDLLDFRWAGEGRCMYDIEEAELEVYNSVAGGINNVNLTGYIPEAECSRVALHWELSYTGLGTAMAWEGYADAGGAWEVDRRESIANTAGEWQKVRWTKWWPAERRDGNKIAWTRWFNTTPSSIVCHLAGWELS